MINIQQDLPEVSGLEHAISKNKQVYLTINKDEIKKDIGDLRNKKSINKFDKRNINEVQNYLESIISKLDSNNKINLEWEVDDYILKSKPIQLKHIAEYNIEMVDYISVEKGSLVRVDYRNVLELIALEMMYRDLGESMESMEEKLEDIGITGIYPAKDCLKFFDESIYNLSKSFRIGDSPYSSPDKQNTIEYFSRKKFYTNYYRDIVEYSGLHALTIISNSLFTKLTKNAIDYKICSISDSGIYFITTNEDINDLLNESAIVRAFGRRFEVKPTITVF